MDAKRISKSLIGTVIAIIVVVIILFNSFVVIDSGDRGTVLTWGAFQGTILQPGLHFLIPIAQGVVKIDVRTQKLEIEKSEAYSHDLQIVDVASALNYHPDPNEVGLLYSEIGLSYEDKIIRPALEAAIKQVYAQYTAEDLLAKRGQVQDEIEQAVRKSIEGKHIVIEHYALVNESFSQDYEQAIEQKQIAEQAALKAKNDLDRVKIESEQRVTQAQAEAEAIKIQAEAIQQQGGQAYVQLQAINKWDGKLPSQMIPGSTVPFIDLNQNNQNRSE